jgi:hypothetical protein
MPASELGTKVNKLLAKKIASRPEWNFPHSSGFVE